MFSLTEPQQCQLQGSTGTEFYRNRSRNYFWPEPELASKSARFFKFLLVKFKLFTNFQVFELRNVKSLCTYSSVTIWGKIRKIWNF